MPDLQSAYEPSPKLGKWSFVLELGTTSYDMVGFLKCYDHAQFPGKLRPPIFDHSIQKHIYIYTYICMYIDSYVYIYIIYIYIYLYMYGDVVSSNVLGTTVSCSAQLRF